MTPITKETVREHRLGLTLEQISSGVPSREKWDEEFRKWYEGEISTEEYLQMKERNKNKHAAEK